MATWRGRRAASWWRPAWSRLSAATRTATGGARSLPAFFQQNGWGDAESASGPGSSIAGASLFGAELEALMRDLGIRNLLPAATSIGGERLPPLSQPVPSPMVNVSPRVLRGGRHSPPITAWSSVAGPINDPEGCEPPFR